MNDVTFTAAILPQSTPASNNHAIEKPRLITKSNRKITNPFIRAGNVTGIALEFFIRQMSTRLITRPAADFLSKICNVAAASDAYQLYYSKNTMAEKAGVSSKSVQRYMRIIEASGIMTRTTVTDSVKGHQPNLYTFAPTFIAAVRSFFTEQVSASRLKSLRSMAQIELSKLVDTALKPFTSTMRKVANLQAAKVILSDDPMGQIVPCTTGQSDPQEVVKNREKEDQNPSRQPGSIFNESLKSKAMTGAERKAMTNHALLEARHKRVVEDGKILREQHAKKRRSIFLTQRGKQPQTTFNHARLTAEGKRHDATLAAAKENAVKDPSVIRGHLSGLRALLGRKRPLMNTTV